MTWKFFKSKLIGLKGRLENWMLILFPGFMKRKIFSRFFKPNNSPKKFISESEMIFLPLLVKPATTVIDIGANEGLYLYVLEKSGRFKSIFGFEPFVPLFKRLKRLFPDLNIFNLAMSNSSGEAILRTPIIKRIPNSFRSSLEQIEEKDITGYRVTHVEKTTLDEFALTNGISQVGLIKIDVEGHEIAVIDGARAIISRDRPVLLVEIEQRHHPTVSVLEIFKMITGFGYRGYFFSRTDYKFHSLEEFQIELHQKPELEGDKQYHNNFIFLSSEADYSKILQEIESMFFQSGTTIF